MRVVLIALIALATLAGGCAAGDEREVAGDRVVVTPDTGVEANPDISDIYDPVAAGEDLPPGFRQLLERDDIFPVYAPSFVRAGDVDWSPENLVIGVTLEDEPRAYPVGFLRRREIVVDNHRGIPTLVTW